MPNALNLLANPLRALRARAPKLTPPSGAITPQTPVDAMHEGLVPAAADAATREGRNGLTVPIVHTHAAKSALLRAPPTPATVEITDVPLTRTTLKEWERAQGLSPEEAAARKHAAKLILQAHKTTFRTGFSLNVQNLDLSSVTHLRSLPPGLRVNGTLTLTGLQEFTQFPANVKVTGSIILDQSGITTLPENFTVSGTLSMCGCHLKTLPKGLTADVLLLDDSMDLRAVPADLCVKEKLSMDSCPNLEILAPSLNLPPVVSLCHCPKVRRLPDVVKLKSLAATNCDLLESMPSILEITGSFKISGCPLVRSFAAGSSVGTFQAVGCRLLTAVPERISGLCDITDCPLIDAFPPTCTPNRLRAVRCAALREIPAWMARGLLELDISSSGVRKLPAFFEVGHFKAIHCADLHDLPNGFVVRHGADISGSGVRAIPADIQVGQPYQGDQRDWVTDTGPDTLRANNCPELQSIGAFAINAAFEMSGCNKIKELPRIKAYNITVTKCATMKRVEDHYEVQENFDVSDNPALEHIGLGKVPQKFFARRCGALREIDRAQGFHSGYFNHCVDLSNFPHNLTCARLDLSDCISLERLPPRLRVMYALTLAGCTNLEGLTDDCDVARSVDVRGCPLVTGFSLAFLSRNDRRPQQTSGAATVSLLKVYTDGSGIDVDALPEETLSVIQIDREVRPQDKEAPAVALTPTVETVGARRRQYAQYSFETLDPLVLPKEYWNRMCPFSLDTFEDLEKPLVVKVINKREDLATGKTIETETYHVYDAENYDFGSYNTFFKHWVEHGTDPESRAVLHFEDFRRGVKTEEEAEQIRPRRRRAQ